LGKKKDDPKPECHVFFGERGRAFMGRSGKSTLFAATLQFVTGGRTTGPREERRESS